MKRICSYIYVCMYVCINMDVFMFANSTPDELVRYYYYYIKNRAFIRATIEIWIFGITHFHD